MASGRKGIPAGEETEWSLCLHTQEAESKQVVTLGYKASKPHPLRHTSSSKASPLKGSRTFLNSAINWQPIVQTHTPMGDIHIKNHRRTLFSFNPN